MYGEGISREGDLLDLAVDKRIVEKSGAWFAYGGRALGQGRENVKQFLRDNPAVRQASRSGCARNWGSRATSRWPPTCALCTRCAGRLPAAGSRRRRGGGGGVSRPYACEELILQPDLDQGPTPPGTTSRGKPAAGSAAHQSRAAATHRVPSRGGPALAPGTTRRSATCIHTACPLETDRRTHGRDGDGRVGGSGSCRGAAIWLRGVPPSGCWRAVQPDSRGRGRTWRQAGGRRSSARRMSRRPTPSEEAAAALERTFGPIDVWINNAMATVFSPVAEMTPGEFEARHGRHLPRRRSMARWRRSGACARATAA
jgi:hypothetical protein